MFVLLGSPLIMEPGFDFYFNGLVWALLFKFFWFVSILLSANDVEWFCVKVGICELPFHPISSEVIGGVGGT